MLDMLCLVKKNNHSEVLQIHAILVLCKYCFQCFPYNFHTIHSCHRYYFQDCCIFSPVLQSLAQFKHWFKQKKLEEMQATPEMKDKLADKNTVKLGRACDLHTPSPAFTTSPFVSVPLVSSLFSTLWVINPPEPPVLCLMLLHGVFWLLMLFCLFCTFRVLRFWWSLLNSAKHWIFYLFSFFSQGGRKPSGHAQKDTYKIKLSCRACQMLPLCPLHDFTWSRHSSCSSHLLLYSVFWTLHRKFK